MTLANYDNIDMILLIVYGVITCSYLILISLYLLGWKRLLSFDKNNSNQKEDISVIIAFRNEQDNLKKLIDSILDQDYPKNNLEIILVDDHSKDGSIEIIQSYHESTSLIKFFQLDEFTFGKKEALKLGLQKSKSNLVVFTDADCMPHKSWLNVISSFAQSGYDLIIGPVMLESDNSFSDNIQALDYSSLMAIAAGSAGVNRPVNASSANLAFKKELINLNDDFFRNKLSSGDDMFLLHYFKKIKHRKITFLKSKEATVITSPVKNIYKALKQRQRWASKSIHYTDFDTIIAGSIVFLFNLIIILTLIFSIYNTPYIFLYFIILIVKSIVDFSMLYPYLNHFQNRRLLKVFLPLQVIYPFYIVFTFLTGIIFTNKWKERKII